MADIQAIRLEAEAEQAKREAATRRLSGVVNDFVIGLQMAWFMSTRHSPINNENLSFRLADELIMSAIATRANVESGALNPARRELRFILEQSIKYAYLDQHLQNSSLQKKIGFLKYRDIELVTAAAAVQLPIEPAIRDKLLRDIGPLFGRLSEYVHPSVRQLQERLRQNARGAYIGFEGEREVWATAALASPTLDIALLYFVQALGFSLVGDLVALWEERVGWSFHHTQFMAALSDAFNYKHERQNGDAGPVHLRLRDLGEALQRYLDSINRRFE